MKFWEKVFLNTKFQLKLKILIFWTKFAQKGYFWFKTKCEHPYQILHIQNSLGTKFKLKLTILNFWTKLPQNGYFRKNEKHHRILHIRISLGSKFQFQQTVLSF